MKAVFLDRDGTIIEDTHYIRDPNDVVLLPNAVLGLKKLKSQGYSLFVVSNQSGVGRGIISDTQFEAVHKKTCELLKAEGVEIDEFAYCFHRPEDECGCRKPRPGLITKTYQNQTIALEDSFVVGDKDCDLELAENVGAKPVLVLTGKGQKTFETLKEQGSIEKYSFFPDLLKFAESIA
jgi:D-glycero-D-manno-heptose 1,7-bisphosphate phosphatase